MFEFGGREHATRLMEKILTQYVDDLNKGEKPDLEVYINQCPEECREELANLINTTLFLKENLLPSSFYERELKAAHNLVSRLARERKANINNYTEKTVVNFRKGNLTSDKEQIINDELEKLWKEEFGGDDE